VANSASFSRIGMADEFAREIYQRQSAFTHYMKTITFRAAVGVIGCRGSGSFSPSSSCCSRRLTVTTSSHSSNSASASSSLTLPERIT
jgi:hypothetical protein